MGLLDNAIEALRFKDTIFYKEDSDLQEKYNVLKKLDEEYPNNEKILNELYIVKKGLDGENEIAYQLKKAHIGMYVLHDIKMKYEDLTAQIDYVIITPVYTYFVECKNLIGNITVTDKGEFIREYSFNGKKVKKGMYSPLRQVEAQREVVRKIWEKRASKIRKILSANSFDYYRRVLVVIANQDTILDTNKAPKEMKYKIIRSDSLIKQIQYDIEHRKKDEILESKKSMEEAAESYIEVSQKESIDYYEYYKKKYCEKERMNDNLKERLIELRKKRAKEMNIPAYYIFTNDELEKILKLRPKTIEELEKSNILPQVKVKTHGLEIINLINIGENI